MKPRDSSQNPPPNADLDEAVAYWIMRLSAKDCTDAERRVFENWLAQHPLHQQRYDQAQAQWQAMEAFKTMRFPEREAALRYRAAKKTRYFPLATAATVVLALGLTAFDADGWLGSWETYQTEKGGHSSVLLADGSRVELNTESEIQVHFNHWQRHVELIRGEAFFSVAHNAARPFKVQAGVGIIEDIGTQFEVFLKENQQVLVAVEEGSVSVTTSQTQELVAGQQLLYADSGEFSKPTPEEISALTAWRQGQLRFNNRKLADVLEEIGRYHDIRIHVSDPKLAKLAVSGVFKTHNLQGMMNAITLTLPVAGRYENANTIVLEPR